MNVKKIMSVAAAFAVAASTFVNFTVGVNASYTSENNKVTIEAEHTAHSQWGSNSVEYTVDNETEYFNNDADAGWSACGYMQFDISDISDLSKFVSASLSFYATSAKGYTSDLYYLTSDSIDLSNDLHGNGNDRFANEREKISTIESVKNGRTVTEDVTDVLKERSEKGNVTFMLTAQSGGASFNGKTATSNKPQLTVTYGNIANFVVTKDGSPVSNVPIVINDIQYPTGDDGKVSVLLVPGSYTYSIAQSADYDSASGTVDISSDDATENVSLQASTATASSVTVNYVDSKGTALKTPTTVDAFVGQVYTFDDDADEIKSFVYTDDNVSYTAVLNSSAEKSFTPDAEEYSVDLLFDLTENSHTVSVTTAPYAKLVMTGTSKTGKAVSETFYSDHNGKAQVDTFVSGEDYAVEISKNGYTALNDTIAVTTEGASVNLKLTPSDGSVFFNEDFKTAGITGGFYATQSAAGNNNLWSRINNDKVQIIGGGSGNRDFTIPLIQSAEYTGYERYTLELSTAFENAKKDGDRTTTITMGNIVVKLNATDDSDTSFATIDVNGESIDYAAVSSIKVVYDTVANKTSATLAGKTFDVNGVTLPTSVVVSLGRNHRISLESIKITGESDPVISAAAANSAPAGVDAVSEPAASQALTKVTADADTTYGDISEGKTLTTIYIKVDNAVDNKVPAITLADEKGIGKDNIKLIKSGLTDIKAQKYYVYQILSDAAVDIDGATITYEGASDYTVE